MDRRAFLTLLASAPIAALAPWGKLIVNKTIYYVPYAGSSVRLYDGEKWIQAGTIWAVWNPDFEVRVQPN